MKKYKLLIPCVILVFLLPADLFAQAVPPEGWRFPREADYTDNWVEYRDEFPVPFHIRADFNGDGLTDDAWIVIGRSANKTGGLCVFLAQHHSPPKSIMLEIGFTPQEVGLAVVPPGQYKTLCGKGYFDCKHGEPEEIYLTFPSIDFIYFGKANIYFWWDKESRTFKQEPMSD